MTEEKLLLEDIRVIDAASFIAGPAAATIMSDYGAEVIKIEPPEIGDSLRWLISRGRMSEGPENYCWQLTSRNKRSLSLNLKDPKAHNILRKLVKSADVFITNILKCRPPKNRDPSNEEAELCSEYLNEQINRIKPKLVLALGRVAAQKLLSTTRSIGQLRGHIIQIDKFSIAMVATYHPAYLLRSPKEKSKSWEDLRLVRNFLNNQA